MMKAIPDVRHFTFKSILVVALFFTSLSLPAQLVPHDKIPQKPNPPRLVNDFANMLSPGEKNALESKLVAYNDSTSNQITIVTVETTHGYSGDQYATEIGQYWGVGGQAKFDNGIVILVSNGTKEADGQRRYFIATGYGLEGALPAITTNAIAQEFLVPNLKNGDYYTAFDQTTNAIIRAAAGEYKAPEGYARGGSERKRFPSWIIVIIIIVIISLINRRGGGGGGGGFMSRRGYRGGLAPFIFGSMLGRGFGGSGGGGFGGIGGGGSGGGFGGFGGGGFGGGGSGGNW